MLAKKLFFLIYLSLCALSPITTQAEPPKAPMDTTLPVTQESPAPAPVAPAPKPIEPESVLDQPAVSYESAFFKMLLTLGGLILLVFLTIWILRRLGQGKFGSGGSSRTIHILEKRPLSAKSMLYLVQVGGKQVLISESQFEVRQIACLDEITDDTP